VELAAALRATEGSLMARATHVYAIDHVAKMIGESRELIEVVSWNSDNIDYGEMIHVHDGPRRASPPSRTAALKACRNSSPMSGPGMAASVNSWSTNDASPT